MSNKYTVEYAKSGRAGCKDSQCKGKIDKDEMRIGKVTKNPFSDNEEDTKTDWYHYKCIFNALTRARAATKKIDSTDDLDGFEDLKPADQSELEELIQTYTANGYKPDKKAKAPAKKKKKDDDDDEDDDDGEKKKKSKAKPKAKAAAAKPAKKAKRKADSDEEEEEEEEEKPAKKQKKTEKKGAGAGASSSSSAGSATSAAGLKKVYMEKAEENKFWEVSYNGKNLTVRFGSIGEPGSTSTREFDDPADQMDRLIANKTDAGFKAKSK